MSIKAVVGTYYVPSIGWNTRKLLLLLRICIPFVCVSKSSLELAKKGNSHARAGFAGLPQGCAQDPTTVS